MLPSRMNNSSANNPDLDWSQVQETILMLKLAVAQIELSLRSGDESVTTLADSFTKMAENVDYINNTIGALPASTDTNMISEKCKVVSNEMHSAIIAFQFYDKLTQRLSHLSNGLGNLAALVKEPTRLYNPNAWQSLQSEIKSTYTTQTDIAMFEAILAGKTIDEALKATVDAVNQEKDDDIELF